MKHLHLNYDPPEITLLGNIDEIALRAIQEAFDRLTAAGTRVTVFRLLEEVRRVNQSIPNAKLSKALDRFTKEETRP